MRYFVHLLWIGLLVGCTPKTPPSGGPEVSLASRGEAVYMANCIACHNKDPKLDGPIGPANHGSSLDLVRARVLEAKYPPNYKPKRDTKLMQPMPFLKNDIEALHAFLNE